MSKLITRYFSPEDLQEISAQCSALEKHTAGEVRVCIYSHKPFWAWCRPLKKWALTEFYRLGMHRTRAQTGVMLLILLSKRRFQIIADTGIHRKVGQGTWDEIARELAQSFRRGAYLTGVIATLEKIGQLLATHFPRPEDDRNEISDEVVVK